MPIIDFASCLNENSQIDCIFLDFSKTFDRSHTTDYVKNCFSMELVALSCYGLNNIFNRHQKVIIDGTSSYASVISSSVPQETVLAPFFFYVL